MQKVAMVLILVLGLVIAGFPACSSSEGPTVFPQMGRPAPEFQLDNLDGQPVSLSDFLGKPVLINFWATWCNPCVYEMPFIQEVFDEWSGQGLVVLAINVGESSSKAETFMESHGLSFPVLLDIEGKVAEQYNVLAHGIPQTFLVDRDGVIKSMRMGAFTSKKSLEGSLKRIIP
jgi:cytochrome c biogenesis protein CcmG/thiol:disulfide interchange protein DsbE